MKKESLMLIVKFCLFWFVLMISLIAARATWGQDMHDSNDQAHWYDRSCCNLRDCAPISVSNVEAIPGGWRVTLGPEDHFVLKQKTRILTDEIPYDETLQSQDDKFHACVNSGAMYVICLYVPLPGF